MRLSLLTVVPLQLEKEERILDHPLVRVLVFLHYLLPVLPCSFCRCITGILLLRFSVLSIYHTCCPGYEDFRLIIILVLGSKSWRLGKMMRQ